MEHEALVSLKAKRRGLKSSLTKIRRAACEVVENFANGDPSLLEEYLGTWKTRLQKFLEAEDMVACHEDADTIDLDKDTVEHEDAFFRVKIKIQGYRREFDAGVIQQEQRSPVPASTSGPGRPNPTLPKLDARKPPILKEDTDHKTFV